MQKIPVKLASSGMVLAKPVVRDDGITLVGEGVALTDSLIARFEQSGVSSITVKGNPVDMGELAGGTNYSNRAERLDHLFRKHGGDNFMMTLKKVLGQYFRLKSAAQAAAAAAEAKAEAEAAAEGNGGPQTAEGTNGGTTGVARKGKA